MAVVLKCRRWAVSAVVCPVALLFAGCVGKRAEAPAPGPRDVAVLDADRGATAIILPAAPTRSARYAALELQRHLEKIAGGKVAIVQEPERTAAPIKIAVGDTAAARDLGFPVDALAPWEFLVAERDGVIALAGGDDPDTGPVAWENAPAALCGKASGSCYAVYDFLENCCGVHWYLPSEAGMVLPSGKRLVARMGAPTRRRTAFRSTKFFPPYFNKKMYWLAGSKPLAKTDFLPTTEFSRWLLRNKVGGEPYSPNHSFGDWPARFGAAHPEWFSCKTKGNASPDLAKDDWQPCLTAPGVLPQVVADAHDFFGGGKAYYGSAGKFFGIVPNDNYGMCQCPACKALYNKPTAIPGDGAASFYVWDFINQAARKIREEDPGKWAAGIAYQNYTAPPANFTLEPNVAVTLCNTQGNWTPALREQAYRALAAWGGGGAKARWIGLWEYFNFQRQMTGVPRVAPKLIGEDARKVHEMGVMAEFIEGEAYDEPGVAEAVKELGYPSAWVGPIRNYLNVWIRFKLWDDTRRDVGELLAEHYRLFYGPAAEPARRFYERLESRVTDMSLRGPETFSNERSKNPKIDWEYLCPPEVMKELRGLVDEATRRATAEPYKTRVAWVREGIMEPMEKERAHYLEETRNAPPPRRMEAVCYFLKAAPAIDGDGGDAAWAAAPLGFLNDYKTGAPPKAATTFRMGYDNENLYALFECQDPDVKDLRTQRGADDNVYRDDCVELYLCFDPERKRVAHLVVNAGGVVQDALCHEDGEEVGWNLAGLVAKTKVRGQGYTVEMKIPLKAAGCPAAASGTRFSGNLCREKYSGSPDSRPSELQSWSPAPEGFGDRGSFGQILLTAGDAWHVFLPQEGAAVSATLHTIGKDRKWTLAPGGMKVAAEQDHVRFDMAVPSGTPETRRVTGTVFFGLGHPVDISKNPYVELRFRNGNPDVKLEFCYDYIDAAGKWNNNFFVFSSKDNAAPATRTFIWDLRKGNYIGRPEPKLLQRINVYAHVEPPLAAGTRGFSLSSIRLCRETMRGTAPELVPADSGLH